MNKLLLSVSALTFATIVTQAYAGTHEERWPRWYVGLSTGVAFLDDSDLKGASSGHVDYDVGGMGTVSLGYMPAASMQPFSNMRFEAEAGYHYNSLDSALVGSTPTATTGHLHSFSYMGNAYYDFRNTSTWTPYVGGGAGGSRVYLSRNSGLGNTTDTDNVFAWQLMAGIAYAPTSIPRTEWSLGYRYFVADNAKFNSASGKIKLDDNASHNVEVGAKFRF